MRLSLAALHLAIAGGASLFLAPVMAKGAVVTFDLVCVLNEKAVCEAGPSFGTVTLTDTAPNTVRIDTDLNNSDLKFTNMMFQLSGIMAIVWNLMDPIENPLSLGNYAIQPNPATFNLGSKDDPPAAIQGWNGDGDYKGVIQADGLSTASFVTNNGGTGQYYVAMHIQGIGPGSCSGSDDGTTNCTPGQEGTGSLKVGGLLVPEGDEAHAPEPWTFGIVGISLMALSIASRRKR